MTHTVRRRKSTHPIADNVMFAPFLAKSHAYLPPNGDKQQRVP
jgi:hypothetical protein